jgi:hypothetical protein
MKGSEAFIGGPSSPAKIGFAKLYDRKTRIIFADLLNGRVVPFFDTRE